MGTGYLSAREVRTLLGVDLSTVYRMAADGRLPAMRVGKQWRFPRDGVAAFLPAEPRISPDLADSLIQVLAPSLGVMMIVTGMDGRPITPVANPCPWWLRERPDPASTCTGEWRALADEHDLTPAFRAGALGFECARSFVRSGNELIGMVLAGGLAPVSMSARHARDAGLFVLGTAQRAQALDALPRAARMLSGSASPRATSSMPFTLMESAS